MADDDGTGTIKLAGAQTSLIKVLRNTRPGATVGLWTYPDDSDCGSGRSAIDMGPLDQNTMIPAVQSLEANGGTPTGTALRAAVDSIKDEHPDGATVLLISDGLHTCDPDPCDTAEGIVDDGFDLTVFTAGFQTSEEGASELACIADATGGETYEAKDSEQLDQVVSEATRNQLTLDVSGMPRSVPAGAARRITVTVSNDTAQDIADAQVLVSFPNASGITGRQVIPSILPPRMRLGRIKAGESTSRSWLVGFGSPQTTGTAKYHIAAWGVGSQPVSKDGTVSVTSSEQTLDDAGGLIGSLKGRRIAILGDSYSAGEGAGDYLPGTGLAGGGNGCHKSLNTYMAPLLRRKSIELIACSGAVTAYGSYGKSTNAVDPEQLETFRDRNKKQPVEAAFLTIGGNDIGFAEIIKRCVVGHLVPRVALTPGAPEPNVSLEWDTRCSDDRDWVNGVDRAVRGLSDDLNTAYTRVYDILNSDDAVERRDGRVAPLYVLAYPQPFPQEQFKTGCALGDSLAFDSSEIDFADDLVEKLNNVIESEALALHRRGYRILPIRDTQEAFLPNNTLCPRPGSERFIVSPVDPVRLARSESRQEAFHPNAKGYRAETNTIIAWSVNEDDSLPQGVSGWRSGKSSKLGTSLVARAQRVTSDLLTTTEQVDVDLRARRFGRPSLDLRAGQHLDLAVSGGAPGSTVMLGIASRVQTFGSVVLNGEGRGHVEATVPSRTVPGQHHLQVIGFDADNGPAIAAAAVDVAAPYPWWFLVLLVGSVGLLLFAAYAARPGHREAAS